MLHGSGAGLGTDFPHDGFAIVSFYRARGDLDQLVRVQRAVDFRDHPSGQPLFTDHHDRIEPVRARLERLANGGSKLAHPGSMPEPWPNPASSGCIAT